MSDRKLIERLTEAARAADYVHMSTHADAIREAITALSAPIPREPIGVLWQHGETGRHGVEFTGDPRSYSHMATWLPVGALVLQDAATQPAEQTTINDAGERQSGESPVRDSRPTEGEAGPASPSAQPAVPDNGRVATTQGSREPERHILRSAHHDPRDAEIARLRTLLREVEITMRHAETFIVSREKMHSDGVMLYRQLLVETAFASKGNAS